LADGQQSKDGSYVRVPLAATEHVLKTLKIYFQVIYRHGGFHVPLTTTWSKEKCGVFGEDSVSLDPGSTSGIFSEESLKVHDLGLIFHGLGARV